MFYRKIDIYNLTGLVNLYILKKKKNLNDVCVYIYSN